MTHTMIKPLAVLLSVLVAGCTPMQWHQPGVSEAEFHHDAAECNALAREQAYRQSPYPRLHWPHTTHRFDGPSFGRDTLAWRLQRERDLYDFCLRSRGYRLTPAR